MQPTSMDFLDAMRFPSQTLRELAWQGATLPGLGRHPREMEVMGWLESRYARAVSVQAGEAEIRMMEAELKAIYVSAGVVDAMRQLWGTALTAEELVERIAGQIRQALFSS